MKIKIATETGQAIPRPLHTVQVRATKHGIVVQTRPQRDKRKFTQRQLDVQTWFAFAGRMASNPTSLDARAAMAASRGTEQVPRDILTMAALGRYYQFVMPDGSILPRITVPVVRPEPPPEPEPPAPSPQSRYDGMHWSVGNGIWDAPTSSSQFAWKGNWFRVLEDMTVSQIAGTVDAVAGASYRFAIGTTSSVGEILTLAVSDIEVADLAGHRMLFHEIDAQLTAETRAFAMLGRTDSGGTYALPVAFPGQSAWTIPLRPIGTARHTQTAIDVGQSITVSFTLSGSPIGMTVT